jgi:hypothetical protein
MGDMKACYPLAIDVLLEIVREYNYSVMAQSKLWEVSPTRPVDHPELRLDIEVTATPSEY